jgi:hypothetical protein
MCDIYFANIEKACQFSTLLTIEDYITKMQKLQYKTTTMTRKWMFNWDFLEALYPKKRYNIPQNVANRNRTALDKSKVTDIRGHFEYDMVLSENKTVLLRLRKYQNSAPVTLRMNKETRTQLPQPATKLYPAKIKLPFNKAQDIFFLTQQFCKQLTTAQQQYWYPQPTEQNTTEYEEHDKEPTKQNWIMEWCQNPQQKKLVAELLKDTKNM